MNHTPGPWIAEYWTSQGWVVTWGNKNPICHLRWTDGLHSDVEEIVEADANLIASAPELLEVLEFVASRYFTGHAMTPELSEELQNDFPIACELVHSAIAKAKGE